jgi:hypothetical protein
MTLNHTECDASTRPPPHRAACTGRHSVAAWRTARFLSVQSLLHNVLIANALWGHLSGRRGTRVAMLGGRSPKGLSVQPSRRGL